MVREPKGASLPVNVLVVTPALDNSSLRAALSLATSLRTRSTHVHLEAVLSVKPPLSKFASTSHCVSLTKESISFLR